MKYLIVVLILAVGCFSEDKGNRRPENPYAQPPEVGGQSPLNAADNDNLKSLITALNIKANEFVYSQGDWVGKRLVYNASQTGGNTSLPDDCHNFVRDGEIVEIAEGADGEPEFKLVGANRTFKDILTPNHLLMKPFTQATVNTDGTISNRQPSTREDLVYKVVVRDPVEGMFNIEIEQWRLGGNFQYALDATHFFVITRKRDQVPGFPQGFVKKRTSQYNCDGESITVTSEFVGLAPEDE